ASRAAGSPGSAAARTPTRRTSTVLLPRGRPLSDTVLAVVGDRRTVGIAAFRRGWAQVAPPARPDSLTPQGARRFLDLLIDKETLAERAIQETWEWTSLESAQVANLGDRAMMRTALDSALAAAAATRTAHGEPALGPEPLGVAVRESTVVRLEATYDEALIARLARAFAAIPRPSADSSIWSRLRAGGPMPVIDPADLGLVVAWSGVGTYKVVEMLDAWRKLNPLFRPRIETPEQVRDLVKNGLFERALRRDTERHHLDRHPRVVEAVERQREYLAVQYFVTREVYARIPTDSLTLRRYYDRDPEVWIVPTRLGIVRLLLPERGEAARMAVRLRDAAEAETLVVRGLRQRVDYRAEITARSDSALFAHALRSGTGTVLGPESVSGGWQVVRVNAVLPPRGRAFEEVRELV
ncbi:MAG: peptidylprolyl isomerase, partial [Candidatus Eisenbacteria bacterium]